MKEKRFEGDIRINSDDEGTLRLWYDDVPGSRFDSSKSLVQNLEEMVARWRLERDIPQRNNDPWADGYADKLQALLGLLK